MIYSILTSSYKKNISDNLSFRRQVDGPETDLVTAYIDSQVPKAPKGQNCSIFLEPKIETYFPDVVITYWQKSITKQWSDRRDLLQVNDIKLLHFLSMYGPTDEDILKYHFQSYTNNSITRLQEAYLIFKVGKKWKARSINRIFSVRRLIAIEAKISDWREALQQAILNTWFASESYILLPSLPQRSNLLNEAQKHGIGVLTKNTPVNDPIIQSNKRIQPSSYASWLFNEWSWKVYRKDR